MSVDEKKSPLRRPPLRQAGQSLQEECDRILDDKIMYHFVVALFIVVMAVYDWCGWYFKTPRLPWLTTFLAIGYVVFGMIRLRPLFKLHRRLKLGRDGERIVSQELEKLRAHGYRIYHDFLGDGFNIDHIVVGPTGVFTINTKTISMPRNSNEKIDYDGRVIRIPGTRFS